MELFNNRKLKKSLKSKSTWFIITILLFLFIKSGEFLSQIYNSSHSYELPPTENLIALGIFLFLFLLVGIGLLIKILNIYNAKFTNNMLNLANSSDLTYVETKNIINELKILFSIDYDLKIFIHNSDKFDIALFNAKDTLVLTSAFVNYIPRDLKTSILEHVIYREKENLFNDHLSYGDIHDKYAILCEIVASDLLQIIENFDEEHKVQFLEIAYLYYDKHKNNLNGTFIIQELILKS